MKRPPWILAATEAIRSGGAFRLDEAEARHVSGALRVRPGAPLVVVDGRGTVAEAVVREATGRRVVVEVTAVEIEARPDGDGVVLGLAVVDRQPMDWAVHKAVEIGVRRFVPVMSERTQATRDRLPAKVEHWRKIAMQALKQCRRPWAMAVEEVVSVGDFVDRFLERGVVADAGGRVLAEIPRSRGGALVVGPEGGFTAVEYEILSQAGWPSLSLGSHVLRAETAAVVGAAMLVARDEGRLETTPTADSRSFGHGDIESDRDGDPGTDRVYTADHD